MKILNYLTIIMVTTTATLHVTAAEQPMPAKKPVDLGNLSVLPKDVILNILSQNINWNAGTVKDALEPVLPFFRANKYAASLKDDLLALPAVKDLKTKLIALKESTLKEIMEYEAEIEKDPMLSLFFSKDSNALHHAVMNDDLLFLEKVVPALNKLKLFNLINKQDDGKNTPLGRSLHGNNNVEKVAILLENGANANIKNGQNYTPLAEVLISLVNPIPVMRRITVAERASITEGTERSKRIAKLLIEKTDCAIIKEIYNLHNIQNTTYFDAKKFIAENLPTNCPRNFLIEYIKPKK